MPSEPVIAQTHPEQLALLLDNLREARRRMEQQRSMPRLAQDRSGADGELLEALELYIAALVSARRPVPYALRDELTLRRGLRRSPYGR